MPCRRVDADDVAAVEAVCAIRNAARLVDDPSGHPDLPALLPGWLRYGWDLDPVQLYLYTPEGADHPVGAFLLGLPQRDNRDLAWIGGDVHPACRRRGHGSAMMASGLELIRGAGRHTVWASAVADSEGPSAYLQGFGFRAASQDARRVQRISEVDWAEVDRLDRDAALAAADYELVRTVAPTQDDVLVALIEVSAAINDAPHGELSEEPQIYDVQRLRDLETAAAGRGDTVYRVFARHRDTGEIGGHTMTVVNPLSAAHSDQGDTAVARPHRGHRLGLRLKIDMMRWLAEVEPELETLRTFNNADNHFMIDVNEALGYRLSNLFTVFELHLS